MKKLSLLLSLLLVLSLGCNQKSKRNPAQNNTPKPTASYVNHKYGFQVNFPAKPQTQAAKVQTSLGQVDQVTFATEQGNLTYLVQVLIFPQAFADQVNASQSVKTQVKETAKNLGLTEVNSKENNIPGRPSFYFEGSGNNNVYALIQAVALKNKMYIVSVLAQGTNAKELLHDKGVKFIKSFKVIE